MFTLIFNSQCAQKFQVLQIPSHLQKPVLTKQNVCKIIHLKLFLVNIDTQTATFPSSVNSDDGVAVPRNYIKHLTILTISTNGNVSFIIIFFFLQFYFMCAFQFPVCADVRRAPLLFNCRKSQDLWDNILGIKRVKSFTKTFVPHLFPFDTSV